MDNLSLLNEFGIIVDTTPKTEPHKDNHTDSHTDMIIKTSR